MGAFTIFLLNGIQSINTRLPKDRCILIKTKRKKQASFTKNLIKKEIEILELKNNETINNNIIRNNIITAVFPAPNPSGCWESNRDLTLVTQALYC